MEKTVPAKIIFQLWSVKLRKDFSVVWSCNNFSKWIQTFEEFKLLGFSSLLLAVDPCHLKMGFANKMWEDLKMLLPTAFSCSLWFPSLGMSLLPVWVADVGREFSVSYWWKYLSSQCLCCSPWQEIWRKSSNSKSSHWQREARRGWCSSGTTKGLCTSKVLYFTASFQAWTQIWLC